MDSEEFTYWAAYNKIDPIGSERGDHQAALIATVIAQANAKKGHRPRMQDFILDYKGKPRLTDPAAILAALASTPGVTVHGGN